MFYFIPDKMTSLFICVFISPGYESRGDRPYNARHEGPSGGDILRDRIHSGV